MRSHISGLRGSGIRTLRIAWLEGIGNLDHIRPKFLFLGWGCFEVGLGDFRCRRARAPIAQNEPPWARLTDGRLWRTHDENFWRDPTSDLIPEPMLSFNLRLNHKGADGAGGPVGVDGVDGLGGRSEIISIRIGIDNISIRIKFLIKRI